MTTTPSAVGQPLSSGAAIRLVAGREITTRIRSKAFIITTAVFVLVVVAGGLLLGLVQGSISATSKGRDAGSRR
jgi:ABC-2 type transport system permease protein